MTERIFTLKSGEAPEAISEMPFDTEADLQALLAAHPELLDGEQISPGNPRRWMLIKSEKGVSETVGSALRWSVDILLVDQDATPTLIEIKRGSNPENRRAVVGQLLEYAAHASKTWSMAELRREFAEHCSAHGRNPDVVLEELLQKDKNPDSFWEDVAANVASGQFRLLFVADEIPGPLRETVAFLNSSMPNMEVLAVEIKQYPGRSELTFIPQVYGRIEKASLGRSAVSSPRLTPETFLEDFVTEETRDAAERLLETASMRGATTEWGPSGVSIRGRCARWPQPITVAWLYSPSKANDGWMRTREFSFGAAILDNEPPPDDELSAASSGVG